MCRTRNSLMNGASQLIDNDINSHTKIARALIIMKRAADDIFDLASEKQRDKMVGCGGE